jgi:Rps23 Pro-64 3,4-dihydroxylase Tpa1-like proline 4-hydroxylase
VLEQSAPTSIFKSNFGEKKEWKEFPTELVHLTGLLDYLSGSEFIESLRTKFDIPKEIKLYPDDSYDGGGYVISPPGSYLGYHADFNFSSHARKYRVLNVLIYMNEEYHRNQGGLLHLLDPDSKTVEAEVMPEANTMLAFFTDDISFHGVSRNNHNFFRRSFNLYYYADQPISTNQGSDPHKTIWLDTEVHSH